MRKTRDISLNLPLKLTSHAFSRLIPPSENGDGIKLVAQKKKMYTKRERNKDIYNAELINNLCIAMTNFRTLDVEYL